LPTSIAVRTNSCSITVTLDIQMELTAPAALTGGGSLPGSRLVPSSRGLLRLPFVGRQHEEDKRFKRMSSVHLPLGAAIAGASGCGFTID